MDNTGSLIGRQLANFRIERLLGHGGMGKVYYGFDVRLRRPVAVKVIDDRYRDEELYAERFLREARAMASWQHPNIPLIYQAGEEQGLYYYAMEYIQGLDLEKLLRQYHKTGTLPPHSDVIQIGRAVAGALDYAHQRGAVHRDVKPGNVLISHDGRILLTDFGLVMQAAQGTLGEAFGSPYYISPEQVRSSAWAVPQSDLYALGVMLYRMLTGVLPFDDPSPIVVAHQHLYVDPPSPREKNPDLSPGVERVLLKAMSKAPEERYETGRELIDTLQGELLGGTTNSSQIIFPPITVPFVVEDGDLGEGVDVQSSVDQKKTRRILTLPVLQAIQYTIPTPSQMPTIDPPSSGGLVGWIMARRTGWAIIALIIVLASTSVGAYAIWRNNQPGIPVSGMEPVGATRLFLSTIQPLEQSLQGGQPLTKTAPPSPSLTSTEPEQGAGSMANSPTPTSTRTNTAVTPKDTAQPVVIRPTSTPTLEPEPPSQPVEPVPVIQPPTKTAEPPLPTATREPTQTSTPPPPTPLPPTPVTPTEDPGSTIDLDLSLRKNNDGSLFVINQGNTNVSLASLQVGSGEGQISGGEWGVAELQPGQCVMVRKTGGSSETPPGNCVVVGTALERSGSAIFWESDYSVFYAGEIIGSCGANSSTCNLKFLLSLINL